MQLLRRELPRDTEERYVMETTLEICFLRKKQPPLPDAGSTNIIEDAMVVIV
jgi:hypothetical protein